MARVCSPGGGGGGGGDEGIVCNENLISLMEHHHRHLAVFGSSFDRVYLWRLTPIQRDIISNSQLYPLSGERMFGFVSLTTSFEQVNGLPADARKTIRFFFKSNDQTDFERFQTISV